MRYFMHNFAHFSGAKDITAACKIVFPGALRAMCWSHMIRQADKRLASFDKDLKSGLREDLKDLQYARSEEEFEKGVFCCVLMIITLQNC